MHKSVTYGRYLLAGRRYVLCAFDNKPANLVWNPDANTEISVEASKIFFSSNRIMSPVASVNIRSGNDSVYHPGATFEYDTESEEMWLKLPYKTPNLSPFILSAPRIQAYCEQLYWKKGSDTLHFQVFLGRNDSTALFVTTSYFDPNEFNSINSGSGKNELWSFIKYIQKSGLEEMRASDFAATIHMNSSTIQSLFTAMAQAGFVRYDLEDDRVRVLPKLERYFRSNRQRCR